MQTALDVSNELRHLRRGREPREAERPSSESVASIAVLPFVNLQPGQRGRILLRRACGRVAQHARQDSRPARLGARLLVSLQSKDVALADVGRALNVATLLDGSVRKAGGRVRISVQLVEVTNGCHLWSETYDRKLDDIFAVQDDIAQSVVKELRDAAPRIPESANQRR